MFVGTQTFLLEGAPLGENAASSVRFAGRREEVAVVTRHGSGSPADAEKRVCNAEG